MVRFKHILSTSVLFRRRIRWRGAALSSLLALLAAAVAATLAWALPTFASIDGDPADWLDATCYTDPGGVDDETSPNRADINQFCVHVDADYLYLLMSWDNTGFTGGNASTAGVRFDMTGDSVYDFFLLATLDNSPAGLNSYSVGSCDGTGSCTNADDICSSTGGGGGPCTGSAAAAGATWDDPFDPVPGHGGGGVCGGTNCTNRDAFTEMAIPWHLLGLTGPGSPFIFGNFGSYPSGPAQGAKDDTGANGIACQPDGTCFVSSPTAITLSSFQARPAESPLENRLPVLVSGLVFLAVTLWAWRKRKMIRS